MLFIHVGGSEHELSTKLGVGRQIEAKFKVPINQLFGKLDMAETPELVDIVCIAAGKASDKEFRDAIYDEWDYSDLYGTVQDIVARLMFSGTPEQIEAKIARTPGSEAQKNALRELLGLPSPTAPSTGLVS